MPSKSLKASKRELLYESLTPGKVAKIQNAPEDCPAHFDAAYIETILPYKPLPNSKWETHAENLFNSCLKKSEESESGSNVYEIFCLACVGFSAGCLSHKNQEVYTNVRALFRNLSHNIPSPENIKRPKFYLEIQKTVMPSGEKELNVAEHLQQGLKKGDVRH